MNICTFIPARSGSKGIPNKNIKLLGGKPLICWTIETAFDCDLKPIVNTDSEEIAEVARKVGAEVMMRPPELAQDKTSMFEVLKSEIPKIEPDVVLLLSPTVPFRKKLHIKLALQTFANSEYDSLISAFRVPNKYHPDETIVKTPMGLKMADGRPIAQRKTSRQSYNEAWIPSGSIYLFRTENLQKGSIYGERVSILETEETLNINNMDDWVDAENYLKEKNGHN